MRTKSGVLIAAALLAACAESGSPSARSAKAGPAFSQPEPVLAAGYRCYGDLAGSPNAAVLLIPGTTLSPETNFAWNWFRALDALSIPYCTVTLGDHGMNDAQDSVEFVVYGIRETARRSGRRIRVLGYSQGGMIPRWAFKYWPDTRELVEEVVGWSPSNHGTVTAGPTCTPDCVPAFWQQRDNADFIAALNDGAETYPGIDYTVLYTYYDEVVVPNVGVPSSELDGGENVTNLAVQDICPNATTDHLSIGTYDPFAYAATIDALSNPGPADVLRIPLTVCSETLMPGVDPGSFAEDYAAFVQEIADQMQNYPHVAAEPPLRCYVTGAC